MVNLYVKQHCKENKQLYSYPSGRPCKITADETGDLIPEDTPMTDRIISSIVYPSGNEFVCRIQVFTELISIGQNVTCIMN